MNLILLPEKQNNLCLIYKLVDKPCHLKHLDFYAYRVMPGIDSIWTVPISFPAVGKVVRVGLDDTSGTLKVVFDISVVISTQTTDLATESGVDSNIH